MANVIETLADGTVIERDFTEQELAQIELDKIANTERLAKIEELKAAKETAYVKLAAIGLTAKELQALGLQHNLREQFYKY